MTKLPQTYQVLPNLEYALVHGMRTKMGYTTLNGRLNGINVWSCCMVLGAFVQTTFTIMFLCTWVYEQDTYIFQDKINEYANRRLHLLISISKHYSILAQKGKQLL